MSALMKRLERGIEAIKQGDRDKAEDLLDEVAIEPGSREPIPGLLDDAEERFYELRARLSGEQWDEADDDEADDDWDDEDDEDLGDDEDEASPGGEDLVVIARDNEADRRLSLSMEYEGEGASIEVERHEESFRDLEVSARETRDTLVTVQSYNASITLQPDAELPEVVSQNLIHDVGDDREWTECHVEEVRVLKTTLVYKDEPQRPALPCPCEV